jgi:outer membrane protein
MKKLVLSALALCAFTFANAQEKTTVDEVKDMLLSRPVTNLKGQKLFGGAIGFDKEETGGVETTRFDIAPKIGFFLADDLEIGASAGFSQTEINNAKTTTYGVSPYARKYWMPEARFMPFAQGDVLLGWGEDANDDTEFAWGLNIRPGFMYRFSKRVAFDTTVGRFGYNNRGGDNNEDYYVRLDLREVRLGVVVFF